MKIKCTPLCCFLVTGQSLPILSPSVFLFQEHSLHSTHAPHHQDPKEGQAPKN